MAHDADADALARLFAEVSLGAPEKAVGFVLWRVVHGYQREIDRVLEPIGLTHLQFTTLTMAAWLAKSGAAVPQGRLGQFSDIQPMQLSLMLKALEGKGLVARTPSPGDGRAKNIEVTQAGVAALRRALPVVIEVQERLFGEQGRPGGSLLEALVQLEGDQMDAPG